METYPVVEDGPLCALLSDPAFLAEIFHRPEDRQAAKRAAKRLPRRAGVGNVIKIERDDVMGNVVLTLMKTPHGRNALHYELTRQLDDYQNAPEDMIAQTIFQSLSDAQEAWFKPLEEELEEDDEELRFLSAGGLRNYLDEEGTPTDPEKARWLAGIVAAFALVSQDDPEELVEVLTSRGEPFASMFAEADE